MSYRIVSNRDTVSNQVIIPAGSRPCLISVVSGNTDATVEINNDRVTLGPNETFTLDRTSLPDCTGEQWLLVFGDFERWAVAWDTPEIR